jgi:hypothetical protein
MSRSVRPRILVLAAALPLLLGVPACTSNNPGYNKSDGGKALDALRNEAGEVMGVLGGPCYPNRTCNAGLTCVNGRCRWGGDGGKQDVLSPGDAADSAVSDPCNPPGYKLGLVRTNLAGDWTVVLEPGTSYRVANISGVLSKEAAATADYNAGAQQVAGFVVSRSATASLISEEVFKTLNDLKAVLPGTVTVRDNGRLGVSDDGFTAVMGVVLDLKLSSTSNVGMLRNLALPAFGNVSASRVSNLPSAWGGGGDSFVIRYAAVQRKDQRVMFIGAVTERTADDSPSLLTGLLSADLAGASGLAQRGKSTQGRCDRLQVTQPLSPVDFIWVVDESGSMNTKRQAIANGATSLFNYAKRAGLDFRMGVTNVCNPNGSYPAAVGKFCSQASSDPNDMGGTDRFLGPTEQTTFSACINNPPGYEGSSEYGLINAEEAVRKHIPRATGQANRIRTGAQVVIIVVTDEVPQSLLSTIGSGNVNRCPLSTTTQSAVDAKVKPLIDLFKGTASPQTKVDYFQVIGGICNNTCNIQVAHGYREVAVALKGQVFDLCQSNLGPSLNKIIDAIVTSGTRVVLRSRPLVTTLTVAVDGSTRSRGRTNGFDYNPVSNSLAFYGNTPPAKGSQVVAAYQRWR